MREFFCWGQSCFLALRWRRQGQATAPCISLDFICRMWRNLSAYNPQNIDLAEEVWGCKGSSVIGFGLMWRRGAAFPAPGSRLPLLQGSQAGSRIRSFYFALNCVAFQQYHCFMALWDVPARGKRHCCWVQSSPINQATPLNLQMETNKHH